MIIAKNLRDESVKPMSGGPPNEQDEREFAVALDLYERRAPRSVLEIGVRNGGTLWHWIQRASKGAKIAAIDMAMRERGEFERWAKSADVSLSLIEGNSAERSVLEKARLLGPYDWVFIDGDHTYHGVKTDWLNYVPMVSPGGCVLLHDVTRSPSRFPDIEVARLSDDIMYSGAVTQFIVSNPCSPTCGIEIIYL
jgi:predicted O-methyltransferase YrrM